MSLGTSASRTASATLRTRVAISLALTVTLVALYFALWDVARSQHLPFWMRKIVGYGFPLLPIAGLVLTWCPKRFAISLLATAGSIWLVLPLLGGLTTLWPPHFAWLISIPLGLLLGIAVAWAGPKWSWLQFRLRTLLVLILPICAGALAAFDHYLGKPAREQQAAINEIEKLGGEVTTHSWAPPTVPTQFGERFFREVTSVAVREPEAADKILEVLPRLGGYKGIRTIRSLSLGYSSITDEGLSKIKVCTNLTELSLEQTDISDTGIAYLTSCKQLETLDLLNCPNVTDRSVAVFRQLPRLRWVILYRTGITVAGFRELREALPKCDVIPDSEHLYRDRRVKQPISLRLPTGVERGQNLLEMRRTYC